MSAEVHFDAGKIKAQIDGNSEKSTYLLKSEIVRGCRPYVPYQYGTLADSADRSLENGEAYVEYTAVENGYDYAGKQYYDESLSHPPKDVTTAPGETPMTPHPDATHHWFEVWKAADGDAAIERVKKAVKW